MTKKTIITLFFFLVLAGYAVSARANSSFDIAFPIVELGDCADKDACRTYCDSAEHGVACAEFSQRHGLGDQKTVSAARAVEQGGPGGCRGEQECHAYCEDSAHGTECVEFAVANDFMTRTEADRALKPGPGGCRGRACQQYCADQAHQEECFEFGVANGFISKDEAKRIREFKKEFKQGPGECRTESECRAYCDEPAHIDECVSFGEKHGFIDKEQARIVKKTHGAGPGGCKGNDECRVYCEDSSHQNECIDFAVTNGFMKPEEAERARKFVGKTGPGGCTGDQCRDFCDIPGNEEACLDFAEREGMIPKEELARAKKFMTASRDGGPGGCRGVQCRDYCADTLHREECFGFAKKQGLISKEEEKHFEAGAKIEEVVRTSGGPGGCKNDDACRAYCTDPSHGEECVAFASAHGGVSADQAREMLKQFTEQRFSAQGDAGEFGRANFDDFKKFEQQSNRRFDEFHALEEQFRGKEFPGFSSESGGFPGRPGEFPGGSAGGFSGGQGGASGQEQGRGGAFAGPGGCTSPAECIKYCTEHREECFGGSGRQEQDSPINQRGDNRQECCPAPGEVPIRLRSNLIREFKDGQLPQDFQQLPQKEREKLFHDQFPQFNPPSPGQFPDRSPKGFPGNPQSGGFPGMPPQEFPGSSGEFLGKPGEFPPSGDFARPPKEFPGRDGSFPPQSGGEVRPPGGFHPPEGSFPQQQQGGFPPPPASGEQFRPPSGSFNDPSGGTFHPPTGGTGTFAPPPSGAFDANSSGSFIPPPSGDSGSFSSPPPSGSFSQPPPSGSFSSPPPSGGGGSISPPPSGFVPITNFFGAVFGGFKR
ncbi:MAG: proline-rich domain-containing protein [Candidatus Sungiibacteriota bacterium]